MQIIAELNDKKVMGQEGLSTAEPRYTARGLIRNAQGKYAVMYAAKFRLYSLPGGGIEKGETPEAAFRREALEETGCCLQNIRELGEIHENRAQADYTQVNYYYMAETLEQAAPAQLTQTEAANGTRVEWHALDEAIRLICDPIHENYQRRYLQARDAAALQAFKEITEK